MLAVLFIIGGLILLALGAEGLVRGSSAIAARMGIAPLVIGLTVVAFGTGSPELFVSLGAALSGNSSIALGNVIGSNISNIALILGVAALVRPLTVRAEIVRREVPVMIGASVLLWLLLLDN
ncbi:MAG: sodium:calcium antiporter, partial [Microcoleus sp. Co-bin12]|nr:sodium:calcium antiporter [Microcoleus sp. Co-bin12]